MGDIIGLASGGIGLIGGLASQLTGDKLSKFLKSHSKNNSKKYVDKVLSNLDEMAAKKKGILKIGFQKIQKIVCKKRFLINGRSYAEVFLKEGNIKLYTKTNKSIKEMMNTLKHRNTKIAIETKLI